MAHNIEEEKWLGSWHAIARRHGASKADHTYMRHYEAMLAATAASVKSVLEIGLGDGSSLKLWLELFPNAHIYGIDTERHFDWDLTHPRVTVHQMDQKDTHIRDLFPRESLDIVIDDGLHLPDYQRASLEILWPDLKPGGWYFIEDIIRPDILQYYATYERFRLFADYLRQSDRKTVSVDDMLVAIRKPPCPMPWEW
jgi:trans-aconitate methyltransferase